MAKRARTSAAGAQPAARFYIKLTLFTHSDLESEVDKPLRYTVPVQQLRSVRIESRFCFVCVYGTKVTADKMVEVKITDDIKVGGNNPCFIIAEVGQNHQGDIEIAKKLIKAAKVSAGSKFFVRR